MRSFNPAPIALFLSCLAAGAFAQSTGIDPLDEPVEIFAAGATAGDVIEAVIEQTELGLIADRAAMELGSVDVHVESAPARSVLEGLALVVDGLEIHLDLPGVVVVRASVTTAAPVITDFEDFLSTIPPVPQPPTPPPSLRDGSVPTAPEPLEPGEEIEDDAVEFEPISLAKLYFRAGLRHLEAGAVELARSCFRRALKEEPEAEFRLDPRVIATLLDDGEDR